MFETLSLLVIMANTQPDLSMKVCLLNNQPKPVTINHQAILSDRCPHGTTQIDTMSKAMRLRAKETKNNSRMFRSWAELYIPMAYN